MNTSKQGKRKSVLHNDHGNAQRLMALHGADLRFCYAFKKWLVWDGLRWLAFPAGNADRASSTPAVPVRTPGGAAAEGLIGNNEERVFVGREVEA